MIHCLKEYKKKLLALAKTPKQRSFIEDSFSRWYMAAPKDEFKPLEDIVNVQDLLYANRKHRAGFDAKKFKVAAKRAYDAIRECHDDMHYDRLPIITAAQESRLRSLYKGSLATFEEDRNILLQLYDLAGINNIHLSIPPIFSGVELFGSPLNTHNAEYCSPFEFEKLFGSLGSFFDYTPHHPGTYLCNPPFDEAIMEAAADRVLMFLDTSKYQMNIVVTIPVWDSATQRRLKLKDYGLKFAAFDKLSSSRFLKEHAVLDKSYSYYDYYKQRKAPASYTHLMILSNDASYRPQLTSYMNKWREWAREATNAKKMSRSSRR
jgi:hypothetical protein